MERQYSFSQLDAFAFCPYSFKLRYIDRVRLMTNTDDAANPLLVGRALHTGIAQGIEAGLHAYDAEFPVETDKGEEEKLKLALMIPKVQQCLPKGEKTYEYELKTADFSGFIDLLVRKENGKFGIYDFKYSNNEDKYSISPQIHIYKYVFESLNPDKEVEDLGYIMVPKTSIRQKKTETTGTFRDRIRETCLSKEVSIIHVRYDEELAKSSLAEMPKLYAKASYDKRTDALCRFCSYNRYCLEDIDYMVLPVNQRRNNVMSSRIKMFVFGAPYSGKSRFADTFPAPLFLNTDGNFNSFTAPYIPVCDRIDGLRTESGWSVFKNAVHDLASGNHDYQTVVIDLIEDAYEYCRKHMYKELGITHESDDSFKAWDKVRTEFLSVMKQVATLPLNVVLLSHEDTTQDITSRSGSKVTAIKPYMQDKIANKLAGMVDCTVRLTAENNGPMLNFKSDNAVFSGSRLRMDYAQVPANYQYLVQAIMACNGNTPVVDPTSDSQAAAASGADGNGTGASAPVNHQGHAQPAAAESADLNDNDCPF